MTHVRRAMILAAGIGSRLKPITEQIPKPLIPVINAPLISHTLRLLRQYGVEEVMINLHHLAGLIPTALGDGSAFDLKIHYTTEKTLLGTGGGVKNVASFFQDETFFLLNGDILCDVNLEKALEEHVTKGAMATMVVRDRDYERFGTIEIDPSGKVRRMLGEGPGGEDEPTFLPAMFTGVHILEPAFLGLLPSTGESCIIRTAYQALVSERGPVQAYWHQGYWNDLGTPAGYLSAVFALLHGRARLSHVKVPKNVSPDALLGEKVRIRPPLVIGPRTQVGAFSRLGPDVAISQDVIVEEGSEIQESILFPGTQISGKVKREIVTPWCRVSGIE